MKKSALANLNFDASPVIDLAKVKRSKNFLIAGLLTGIPTLVVFLYLLLWASPMYISEAKFAVRTPESAAAINLMGTFFRGAATPTDSYIVIQYVHSKDMLDKLDKQLNIRGHYGDTSHDFWSRLKTNATEKELLDYWSNVAAIGFNLDTGIITFDVRAYSPEMAQKISTAVLAISEELINSLNERAHVDAVALAETEVHSAETRLQTARNSLKNFRDANTLFDPEASAKGMYEIVTALEGELTKARAALSEMLSYMKADAPQVISLQKRLNAVEEQVKRENARLANETGRDPSLSGVVAEYQNLRLEEEFSQKILQSAMTSLETTRIQAMAKSLYLLSFEAPTLPDESLYPSPIYHTFLFLAAFVLLLGIVSLIIAAVREHTGF